MIIKHHLSSFFLAIIILLLSANSPAQTTDTQTLEESWNDKLSNELGYIGYEYGYYGGTVDDKGVLINPNFPAEREEELLRYIETQYLTGKNYQQFYHYYNPVTSASNVPFAKLFLSYGGNVFEHGTASNSVESTLMILLHASSNTPFYKNVEKFTNHQGIIDRLGTDRISNFAWDIDWSKRLPFDNLLELVKLFISLGVDVDFKIGVYNAIYYSLETSELYALKNDSISFEYFNDEDDPFDPESLAALKPAFKNRANDIVPPDIPTNEEDDAGASATYYFRTPITYWLEEFIEAGYPASMLDTHKLHYPRFMKEASVAEVTAMLQNPDTHKIPANINCPYQRKQGAGDEVAQAVSPAELCPLTPSVNMRDAMGRTPLHIAGEQGNKAVFNALIKIGADESVKDFRQKLAKLK